MILIELALLLEEREGDPHHLEREEGGGERRGGFRRRGEGEGVRERERRGGGGEGEWGEKEERGKRGDKYEIMYSK